jgi:hypothetical protein
MNQFLSKLYSSSPKEMLQYVRGRLRSSNPHPINDGKAKEVSEELRQKFKIYQPSNLQSISSEEFSQYL